MRLDPDDLTELAAFFAKRFPVAADRRALAADAGVRPDRDPMASPEESWLILLGNAHAKGRLRLLAHAVARRAPDDANLMGVCQVITGTTKPGRVPVWDHPRTAPALAAVAVALLGLTAAVAFRDAAPTDIAPLPSLADTPVAEADAPTAGAPTDGLVAIEAGASAAPSAKPWKAGNPLDAKAAGAPEASPRAAAPAVDRAHFEGRCTVKGGGIVGYWYAGRSAPAAAGELLVMPGSVNVRADYPDKHNRFDARTALRCTLAPGDRVRLTADPIAVPGGAFWVPLHSGDLQVDPQ
jgi:hypothetical protein